MDLPPNLPRAELSVAERRARFLEVLREARDTENAKITFDLGTWIDWQRTADGETHPCGTTCCAVGLGMMDPVLAAAGLGAAVACLHLRGREAILAAMKAEPGYALRPQFDGYRGIDAAAAFFGIATDDARHCFFREQYVFTDGAEVSIDRVIERVEMVFNASR